MTSFGGGNTIGVAVAFFAGGAAAFGLAAAGAVRLSGFGVGGGISGGGGTSRTSKILSACSPAEGVRWPDMPSSMKPSAA